MHVGRVHVWVGVWCEHGLRWGVRCVPLNQLDKFGFEETEEGHPASLDHRVKVLILEIVPKLRSDLILVLRIGVGCICKELLEGFIDFVNVFKENQQDDDLQVVASDLVIDALVFD